MSRIWNATCYPDRSVRGLSCITLWPAVLEAAPFLDCKVAEVYRPQCWLWSLHVTLQHVAHCSYFEMEKPPWHYGAHLFIAFSTQRIQFEGCHKAGGDPHGELVAVADSRPPFQFNRQFSPTRRHNFMSANTCLDHLCGLVVRVPDYRSRGRVRFTAVPDFLRSSGSGTGSTQPLEYNWGTTWKK
jgi:hypothetical protein